jgi:hypothetical protein
MALPTQGCKFEVTKPPGSATLVAEATGWSGPRITRNEIETTHLQSVAKEYLLGLQDPGEFTIDVNFDFNDPGQVLLWNELAGVTPLTVKLTFYPATEGSFSFQALVMNYETTGRPDDKMSAMVTLRVTGGITAVFPTMLMAGRAEEHAGAHVSERASDRTIDRGQAIVRGPERRTT